MQSSTLIPTDKPIEGVKVSQAEDYQLSIEEAIASSIDAAGKNAVRGVFAKYGVDCVAEVCECDLPDVFNEIFTLATCMD